MHDVLIVGAGISGMHLAYLLTKYTNKSVCLLEQSNRIGGLIDTRYFNKTIKYEAGGAVVYDHQKHMSKLICELNIETNSLSFDTDGNYLKNLLEEGKRNPLPKSENQRYISLLKDVFLFMDTKSHSYCRSYTFEQICIQAIGFQNTRFIEYCYGYAGEFRVASALVARKNIENEVFNSKNVSFFKKGYIQIVDAMHDFIKHRVTMHFSNKVLHFGKKKSYYVITTNKGTYQTRNLVFMIPQQSLLQLKECFTTEEMSMFNAVEGISLCRVFSRYSPDKPTNKWMDKIKYSTVNNALRQIIPASKRNGLFQISYSDWYFADFWGKLAKQQTIVLAKKLLQTTFSNNNVDTPTWTKTHYWPQAIHFWKPNHNETKLYDKIQLLRPHLFIGGESFSLNQGWCEGAIGTSLDIFKRLVSK